MNVSRLLSIGLVVGIWFASEPVVRGQEKKPGNPPPWNDLLKNELVVVGQYKSHKNGVMSLQVVDVLRGKTCKPGDFLPVKFSQRIGFKFHFVENGQFVERIAAANDDKLQE